MREMKVIRVDLGGSFPAKSEAVQAHAFELGYRWGSSYRPTLKNEKYRNLYFSSDGIITSSNIFKRNVNRASCLSVEQFLELKSEDVLVKDEPAWEERYKVFISSNSGSFTSFYQNTHREALEALKQLDSIYTEAKIQKVWVRNE